MKKGIENKSSNLEKGEHASRNRIKELLAPFRKKIDQDDQNYLVNKVLERLRVAGELNPKEDGLEKQTDLIMSYLTEEIEALTKEAEKQMTEVASSNEAAPESELESKSENIENKEGVENKEKPAEKEEIKARDESEVLDNKDGRFKGIIDNKITKVTVSTLYKTYGSITGLKFLMDMGLTMTAGAGHLLAKMSQAKFGERVENSTFMETVKSNDMYSYLHDSFAETGARKTRQGLKEEFVSLPAGAEQVADKMDALKNKIENNSKLSPEQKEEYLNKVKAILEESSKESETNKNVHRDKLGKLTEAYVSNQVSGLSLTRDALNLGFSATGFMGARAAAYFGIAVAQRIAKAEIQYGKMLDQEKQEKGIDSKTSFVLKDLFINSTKETIRGLSLSSSDGEKKLTKTQRAVNFIKEAGAVARVFGIGRSVESVSAPDIDPLLNAIHGEHGETFDYFKENLANNMFRSSFGLFGHGKGGAENLSSEKIESLSRPSNQIIERANGSSGPSLSENLHSKNIDLGSSIKDSENAELIVTPKVDHNINISANSEAGYLNNNPILSKDTALKESLLAAKILHSGEIRDGGSVSQALGHPVYNNDQISFIQPDGKEVTAGAGEIFVHPGDKVIETDNHIYVIKDSGVKGQEVPDNFGKQVESSEVTTDKELQNQLNTLKINNDLDVQGSEAEEADSLDVLSLNKTIHETEISNENLSPEVLGLVSKYHLDGVGKIIPTAEGNLTFKIDNTSVWIGKDVHGDSIYKFSILDHNGARQILFDKIKPGEENKLVEIIKDNIQKEIHKEALAYQIEHPRDIPGEFVVGRNGEGNSVEAWDKLDKSSQEFFTKFDKNTHNLFDVSKEFPQGNPDKRLETLQNFFGKDNEIAEIKDIGKNEFSVRFGDGKELFLKQVEGGVLIDADKNFSSPENLSAWHALDIRKSLNPEVPAGFFNDFNGRGSLSKEWESLDDNTKNIYIGLGKNGLPHAFLNDHSGLLSKPGFAVNLAREWSGLGENERGLYEKFDNNLKLLNSEKLSDKESALKAMFGQDNVKVEKSGLLGNKFVATFGSGKKILFKFSGNDNGEVLMTTGGEFKDMHNLDVPGVLSAESFINGSIGARGLNNVAEASGSLESSAEVNQALVSDESFSALLANKSVNKAEIIKNIFNSNSIKTIVEMSAGGKLRVDFVGGATAFFRVDSEHGQLLMSPEDGVLNNSNKVGLADIIKFKKELGL